MSMWSIEQCRNCTCRLLHGADVLTNDYDPGLTRIWSLQFVGFMHYDATGASGRDEEERRKAWEADDRGDEWEQEVVRSAAEGKQWSRRAAASASQLRERQTTACGK